MKKITPILISSIILLSGCAQSSTPAVPSAMPYQRPLIVAHRGARSVAPENTLLAAERAFDFGADQWELDVQETQEGELVVIHDNNFRHTTNVEKVIPSQFPFWKVKNLNLAQVQSLDAGSWFIKEDPFDEIKNGNITQSAMDEIKLATIPTLREALQLTKEKGWSVNVEIKDLTGDPGNVDVVEKVVALIEEMQMENEVLISSFNMDYLVRVKKANPEIKTAALVEKLEDPLALLESIGADAINPSYKGIEDLTMIKTLRDAGFDVYVWTVNDEQTMIKLINAGASGIITDYPQRMTEVLKLYK